MLVKPRRPSGFNEYLPNKQIEFNRLLEIIRKTYEKYGYTPIDTPDIELSEVILAKDAGETEKQIYRFEHGKNNLSLRFDLTVPLARYAAEHENDLIFPFRRYHIGKVHRAERAQAGRAREFYQCDIDVIGSDSTSIDAEFPAVINEIFEKFNFGEFTIRINNRMVLNGFFEGIGLKDVSAQVLRTIDKIEKITKDELIAELKSICLSQSQIEKIISFTEIHGDNDSILKQLSQMTIDSNLYEEGVAKLTELVGMLRLMKVPENRFKIDLRIARGLDYYTGTVYETNLNEHIGLGSVCSGGRYDDLASNYTSTKLAGVGISIGLTRLFYQLCELGVINAKTQTPAKCIVVPISLEQLPEAISLASRLRSEDISTILYTEPTTMKKKMKYADKMGCEYLALIGEDEVKTNTVSVKNMQTGVSANIAPAIVANHILSDHEIIYQ